MQNETDKKTIFGMILFALSVFMLIYMFVNPLNQLIFNVEEYFTLTVINFPISDIINIAGSDTNPPLYYILAKGVGKVLPGIFSLKLLSVIPYAIILVLSAVKIRSDYGWLTAGIFSFAMAVSSEFFTSFMLLRPYAWAILFIVLAYVFLKDITEKEEKIWWVLFTIACVLAAYTYYFAGITAICLYLVLLIYIYKFKKEDVKTWAISLAAFIVLYIPWMFSLAKLLASIREGFWIESPGIDLIIQSLSHFAYSGDTLFGIISILIAAAIVAIYLKSQDESASEITYITGGIIAFILTLAIGLVISFAFQPVFLSRCMIPASALVWLSISIMISKIRDEKMSLIAIALICLLLICGVAGTVASSNELYASAHTENDVLDNITQDDNAVVILTTPNMIIHFLDYADSADMYCIATDYIYGENMDRVHEIFDFKEIEKSGLDEFANNHSDKNVYLISWKEPDVDLNTTVLSDENGVVISKVNPAQEENYY